MALVEQGITDHDEDQAYRSRLGLAPQFAYVLSLDAAFPSSKLSSPAQAGLFPTAENEYATACADAEVSRPLTASRVSSFARRQRSRPSGVRGPVDAPPCMRHRVYLPVRGFFIAGP